MPLASKGYELKANAIEESATIGRASRDGLYLHVANPTHQIDA
jgi:hypothetical protein